MDGRLLGVRAAIACDTKLERGLIGSVEGHAMYRVWLRFVQQ